MKKIIPAVVTALIVIGAVSVSMALVTRFLGPQEDGGARAMAEEKSVEVEVSEKVNSGVVPSLEVSLDDYSYIDPMDSDGYHFSIGKEALIYLSFEGNINNHDGEEFARSESLAFTRGLSGMAAHFVEQEAFVEFPAEYINLASGALSFWVYLESYPVFRRKCIFFDHRTGRVYGGKDTSFLQIYIQDTSLGIGVGTARDHSESIYPVEIERWIHCSLVWNEGAFVVYIDGVAVSDGEYEGLDQRGTVSLGNSALFVQSKNERFKRPVTGMIDEFKLWNRPIDSNEVKKEFEANATKAKSW